MSKFHYDWKLSDGYPAKGVEKNNLKVFSTFACGGGSTMGYKLAGYDVIGANDIDPRMAEVYKTNHNPKHFFLCPITELLSRELPKELYDLDILDGSPPCSTFSMTGSREKAFKKFKKFSEGQAEQVLSDLFFEFVKLTKKLKPKTFIAENVKGLLLGNAKAYVHEIMRQFDAVGYNVQLFLLNGASMGLPQRRERVFFVGTRRDLNLCELKLKFAESPIFFSKVSDDEDSSTNLTPTFLKYWELAKPGDSVGKFKKNKKLHFSKVANTITSQDSLLHPLFPRWINQVELQKIGSFPYDYNYLNVNPCYLIGMSVPPIMIANIALEIYRQFFKK